MYEKNENDTEKKRSIEMIEYRIKKLEKQKKSIHAIENEKNRK